MEVLLRTTYKWTPANFNADDGYIYVEDNRRVSSTEIVSIRDDDRKNYVVCNNCNKIILNTAEALETHFNLSSNSDQCLKCKYRRDYLETTVSKEYELNEDGTYQRVIKENVRLHCNRCATRGPDINNHEARTQCMYAQCREKGAQAIKDIFLDNPGVFDDIVTVDALDPKRWTFDKVEGGYYLHKAKARFRLYAAVNNKGIIDHFVYKYNNYTYNLAYSSKYESIFRMDAGTYSSVSLCISRERIRSIMTEIAKIYKE